MTSEPKADLEQPKLVLDDQVHCALTGRQISSAEAYWAPPLVTARELVTTVVHTAIHTPNQLGQVLFAEQPNVPYAPDVREQLAARRSTEQLKLLGGLMLLLVLIAIPIVLIAMH